MILTDAQLEEIEGKHRETATLTEDRLKADILISDLLDTIRHLKEEMRKARK